MKSRWGGVVGSISGLVLVLVGGTAFGQASVHGLLGELHRNAASINAANLHAHNLGGQLHLSVGRNGQVEAHLVGRGNAGAKAALRARGFIIHPRYDNRTVFTAKGPISALGGLASIPGLVSVRPAFKRELKLNQSVADMGAAMPLSNGTSFDGSSVVVGVLDSGVNADHPDFDDGTGHTRVSHYWDQNTGYQGPAQGYCDSGSGGACVCDCNPSDVGHGTHVASTAAGTFGVAPKAEIIAVASTLYDDDIINGVNWIFENAAGKPCAINLSIGGHFGPHDGTDPLEVGMDEALAGGTGSPLPGRVIVAANGNEGEDFIHANHAVGSKGSSFSIELTVPAYTPIAGASNDYILIDGWRHKNDNLSFSIKTPGGNVLGPWRPRNVFDGWHTNEGTVAAESGNTTNGDGSASNLYIQIWDGRSDGSNPPAAGKWTITFSVDRESSPGEQQLDLWMGYAAMPAKFSGTTGNNDMSVGAPATAFNVIGAGAYVSKLEWPAAFPAYDLDGNGRVHYCELNKDYWAGGDPCATSPYLDYRGDYASFSSHGPTRDGRQKPDVSGPGVGIVAASSSGLVGSPYIEARSSSELSPGAHNALQGTSMSCPHITGFAALILDRDGTMNANAVRDLMRQTARPQSTTYDGTNPLQVWGNGKADVDAALTSEPPVGPVCGNGVVEAGEACDPPDGTSCDASCQTIAPPGPECAAPEVLCSDGLSCGLGNRASCSTNDDCCSGVCKASKPTGALQCKGS